MHIHVHNLISFVQPYEAGRQVVVGILPILQSVIPLS